MKTQSKMIAVALVGIWLLAGFLPVAVAEEKAQVGVKININTASKEELKTLKYIKDKKADSIIAYRKEKLFDTPEEIMKVKGIADKIYEHNKDRIIVKEE